MAMKRKFDGDSDDAVYQNTKQLKLVPFPNYEPDKDCMMSEAQPFYEHYHFRNTSSASSASSYASGSPTTPPYVSMSSISHTNQVSISNVGLLQPHTDFKHHGSSCSTIPKLRVACASGLKGNRTMWSFCEECGAISMVNSD
ncbi:hypothetical protein F5050DRAFT_1563794 [Lentinula boryana]|uniref:Uncharacterized protein n=1 Tax=Lentinula boryana TaxID=40481 RepID=A0ABQ8QNQ2_9AGAR|nr:hypothetical protein F5050DRAFT_1563794 [Lentinula boryana]